MQSKRGQAAHYYSSYALHTPSLWIILLLSSPRISTPSSDVCLCVSGVLSLLVYIRKRPLTDCSKSSVQLLVYMHSDSLVACNLDNDWALRVLFVQEQDGGCR